MKNLIAFSGKLLLCIALIAFEGCIKPSLFRYEVYDKGRILFYPCDIEVDKTDKIIWNFGDGSKWMGYAHEHVFKYNGYYYVEFKAKKRGMRRRSCGHYIGVHNAKDWHSSGNYKEGHIWADFELDISGGNISVKNTSRNTDSNSVFKFSSHNQKVVFNLDNPNHILSFDWWGVYTISLTAKNVKTGEVDIVTKQVFMDHLPYQPVDNSSSMGF